MKLPVDDVPGYGNFFRDYVAGRLPAELDTLRRPERAADWSLVLDQRPAAGITDELAAALQLTHQRLAAPAASRHAVEQLVTGKALVVLTGQQPGLLGGPLYTRLKIGTAVALAEEMTRRLGRPVVPLYWNAADDADFDEVAHGTLARHDLKLLRFSLPASSRVPRGWVGDIPVSAVRESLASAKGAGLGDWFDAWEARGPADGVLDFGEWHAAEVLRWYGDRGLVVVDARWPELRRAAAGLFSRYLESADQVLLDTVGAGDRQRAHGYEPPITADAATQALFVTPERSRLKLDPAEARDEARRLVTTHPSHLSPNVVLRPLVNDVVFPTVAHVVGPAELQYLTQLTPVYDRLGVPQPMVVDRALATLVPGLAGPIMGDDREGAVRMLSDPVEALRTWISGRLPTDLRSGIDATRAGLTQLFDSLREPSGRLDSSLVQIVDSAREKALYQFERLPEGAYKKARQREEAARPGLSGLAEFVRPRTRLQERELSALSVEQLGAVPAVEAAIQLHVTGIFDGDRGHHLVTI